MIFLTLLLIPLLLAVGSFLFAKGITWKEFLVQVAVALVVAGISAATIYYQNTSDTEIWNGVVTNKTRDKVSCRHSYSCPPCTKSCDKKGNCHTTCSTCYEHSYDVDWNVASSTGDGVLIDRVDRQGVVEPGRWTVVRLGEPTAFEHSYTNYIKAAPDTLFRHQGLKEKYATSIPAYPGEVFDYYRLNRLASVGIALRDTAQWNAGLSELNGALGASKQVNMIVVVVKDLPQEYLYALEESWLGGKKNDAVLVIGVDSELKPTWAGVLAWTQNPLFQVVLRDSVMQLPKVEAAAVLPVFKDSVSKLYQRKHMKDFAYLSGSVVPTTTQWIVSLLVALLIGGGLTYFFATQDPFGDERYSYRSFNQRRY